MTEDDYWDCATDADRHALYMRVLAEIERLKWALEIERAEVTNLCAYRQEQAVEIERLRAVEREARIEIDVGGE